MKYVIINIDICIYVYMDSQLRNGRNILLLTALLYLGVNIIRIIAKGKKMVFDPKEYPFLWPLWHIIVMFLLGYLSPKYWYLYLSLSIAWEIVEYFLDKWGIGYLIFGKNAMKKDFRAYNPHDYLWNSLGLLAGVFASKHSRINLMKDIKGLIKP